MTVRQWIAGRSPRPPEALENRILALLGPAADDDVAATTDACLRAAAGALESLVRERRFEREDALELLAIDALTTYAYEYVAAAAPAADLESAARDGITRLGKVADD